MTPSVNYSSLPNKEYQEGAVLVQALHKLNICLGPTAIATTGGSVTEAVTRGKVVQNTTQETLPLPRRIPFELLKLDNREYTSSDCRDE